MTAYAATQEPTDAEVEAAAEALHYAQGFDDWGVANSYEREEARGLARAALVAARAARRDGGPDVSDYWAEQEYTCAPTDPNPEAR